MQFKNYYKILNVKKDASETEIKKSYRQLAKTWHPDKNPDDKTAEAKFKEIAEAYDVLSNPDKRKKFDDFISYENHQKRYSYKTTYKTTSKNQDAKRQEQEYSDFFKQFFNQKKSKQKYSYFKGDDLRGKITIDLEEAYAGSVRVLNVGGGKLRLKIKPGIQQDQILRIPEKGKVSKYGGKSGDLFVRIVIKPHPVYKRDENNLNRVVFTDIYKIILQEKIMLRTFRNDISIAIPQDIEFGKSIRLKGLGMPLYNNPEKFGDLYIIVKYKLPKITTKRELELYKELKQIFVKKRK